MNCDGLASQGLWLRVIPKMRMGAIEATFVQHLSWQPRPTRLMKGRILRRGGPGGNHGVHPAGVWGCSGRRWPSLVRAIRVQPLGAAASGTEHHQLRASDLHDLLLEFFSRAGKAPGHPRAAVPPLPGGVLGPRPPVRTPYHPKRVPGRPRRRKNSTQKSLFTLTNRIS